MLAVADLRCLCSLGNRFARGYRILLLDLTGTRLTHNGSCSCARYTAVVVDFSACFELSLRLGLRLKLLGR